MWGKKRTSSNLVEHGSGDLRKIAHFVTDNVMENGIKLTIRIYTENIEKCNIKIEGYGQIDIFSGDILYFLDNKLYRKNGPAFIRKNDICIWVINGKLHRDGDLPAYESDSLKIYSKNGFWHRVNNPAYIEIFKQEYWINGVQYKNEEKYINESRRTILNDIFTEPPCELELLTC